MSQLRATILPIVFAIIVLHAASVSATWQDQFAGFLPAYNRGFQILLAQNCSEVYALYRENRWNSSAVDPVLNAFQVQTVTSSVIECLLSASPEFVKSKMATADVLLGLMPSILATLGTGPQETGVLAVVARRPLLALLTAIGSPSVFTLRSSEYTRALEELGKSDIRRPHLPISTDWILLLIEYIAVLGGIANVAHLGYQLGGQVIFSILPNNTYIVFLWIFLGVTIHIMGAIAVWFRARVNAKIKVQPELQYNEQPTRRTTGGALVGAVVARQFQPLNRQNSVQLRFKPESVLFYVASWLTSIFTVCHIIFGSILFSSAIFVGVDDAMIIVARLMASVLVCRLILSNEMAVLGKIVELEEGTVQKDAINLGVKKAGE